MKKIIVSIVIVFIGIFVYCLFVSNPFNCSSIKDIPTPIGCTRVVDTSTKAEFFRNLPLKRVGSLALTYKNEIALNNIINYAVVDMPVISNDEQCADMCIRLHAEHQYLHHLPIKFKSVNNENLKFGGGTKNDLYSYLKKVYAVASTYSLSKLPSRDFKKVQIGDVFVYPSRKNGRYGHAISVVDVAKDSFGNIYVMLAEGCTPACDLHILRNYKNPLNSAWFKLDTESEYVRFDGIKYYRNELRYF